MHNLSEAVRKVVAAHRRCLHATTSATPATSSDPPPATDEPARVQGRRADNTRARHHAVRQLLEQGMALKAISRQLQMDVKTVRKYARAQNPEQLLSPNPPSGRDVLAGFKPYLHTRLDEEPTASNATLLKEIQARGYRGSLRTLREYLAGIRRQTNNAPPPPPPVPSARQLTAWIMRPADKLDEADQLGLNTACAACPELAALTELAHGFNHMVRTRGGARLEQWIKQAISGPFPEVRGFAKGLYGDFDAVKAGLTLQWSSGKVEGNVTRVKMIKRQMYGRAKLDLLRKRILAPP